MPHDAKGRELKPGDVVMVPFKVRNVFAADYCNLDLESVANMPPNSGKTTLGAINTKQVLRANDGDDISYTVIEQNGFVNIG